MRNISRVLATAVILSLAVSTGFAETLIELKEPYIDEPMVVGFELTSDAEIDIEAVGVQPRYSDEFVAYAWIIDHETREPVWKMRERDSDRVRGRRSLRKVETTELLKAGKYELYLYAGSSIFGSVNIKGPTTFFEFLGDVFVEGDEDDYFDDFLDECYVRLSSDELKKNDLKQFEVDGVLEGFLLKHTQLEDEEYIEDGFTLKKPGNIRIYSIIEYPKGNETPVDYGWIVNAETRERVWEMDHWNTDWAGGGSKNRMFDEEVSLDKGDYILYFVTDDSHSFERFNVSPPYDPFNWGITILPGKDFDRSSFAKYEPAGRGKSLIDFTRARDDEYFEEAFKLSSETKLHVYAVGEYSKSDREFVDYGWIQEAGSGNLVWEMDRRNTVHAGGNEKNRMFEGDITLDKGEYIAAYVTDGSHSYRDWNASPPYNPSAWGMAIYPGKDANSGNFKIIDMDDISVNGNLLVNLTRVRDHERLRKKFTLDKETRVHIYAIGEGDRDEMFDYAWIVDDRTGRSVWEMTWRNTFHAGGARKNRMFDDDITLEKGTYEVIFVTDGSHSFSDWNDRRPDDPLHWGIMISASDR